MCTVEAWKQIVEIIEEKAHHLEQQIVGGKPEVYYWILIIECAFEVHARLWRRIFEAGFCIDQVKTKAWCLGAENRSFDTAAMKFSWPCKALHRLHRLHH